jgi:hypothetical protein
MHPALDMLKTGVFDTAVSGLPYRGPMNPTHDAELRAAIAPRMSPAAVPGGG